MHHSRLSPVLWTSLIALAVLTACGRAEYGVVSPASSPSPETPTSVASTTIPTPYTPIVATGVPTYVYYGQVVEATAFAIAQTLPTPSPIPSAHPMIQERKKREYLADASMRTAIAMYPPPPGYDPAAEYTPVIATPFPTETPRIYPYIATENGRIYSHSLEDDPIGKMMGHVNRWTGSIEGRLITAYAGYVRYREAQGRLMTVEENPQDPERSLYQNYDSPTQSGSLRIISEAVWRITMQSADGTTFVFDLATRRWVSPPTTFTPGPSPSAFVSPVPSGTPVPTQSP
ncbi:MAG TPA: hypothetical protein VFR15_05665 [Chloroflexia bacterium]|nr:hypothetical protein [Chloroflexia bacterium]